MVAEARGGKDLSKVTRGLREESGLEPGSEPPPSNPSSLSPGRALDSPPVPQPLPSSGPARGHILARYSGPPQDIPPEPPQLAQLPHQSSRRPPASTAEERSPEPAPLRRLRPESPPLAAPRSAEPGRSSPAAASSRCPRHFLLRGLGGGGRGVESDFILFEFLVEFPASSYSIVCFAKEI